MTGKYCSQKFWFLSVNAERREINSCCSAASSAINVEWLKSNPGRLFNTDLLVQERQQMLAGQEVASCTTCWIPESQGLSSRRTLMQSDKQTHTDVYTTPEELSLFLGTDCNLTCSYCCKEYSTAWIRDLRDGGEYEIDDARYKLNASDRIILKLGQTGMQDNQAYDLIVQEALKYNTYKRISLAGGEPFLQNKLVNVINRYKQR